MTTLIPPYPSTAAAKPDRTLALRGLYALLATDNDWSTTAARLTLGAVILPHGAQKLLGWFGGPGFDGALAFLTGPINLPVALATLIILLESVGSLALLLGIGGRAMAAGIASIMVGAVATVHFKNGFFMNWFGAQAGEGFEYHLLAMGLAVVVMLRGSGAASIDQLLTRSR
jgi:putative oxidoreductase